VVAGDEEAHSHQQSTPSPTVTDDEPIHPSLVLGKGELLSLILAFYIRYKLSKSCLDSLLHLLNLMVPGCVPKNNYFFDKIIGNFTSHRIVIHFKCPACESYLGREEVTNLHCTLCDLNYERNELEKKHSYFLSSSLESQLRDMLENTNLWDHISKVKQDVLRGNFNGNIGEVYTGGSYQRPKVKSFLSAGDNFTATFSTDGVRYSKSSNKEFWPVTVTINELNVFLKPSFMALTALWSDSKPKPETFLLPFVQEAQKLDREGFTWVRNGISHVSRVRFIIGVLDAPARAMIANVNQFNGEYGCGYCLDPGTRVKKGDGHVQVYPKKTPLPELRTHAMTLQHATICAARNLTHFRGVKGPSILFLLPSFNVISGLSPDYMHCSLLGATFQFLKLWLTSTGAPYYIQRAEWIDQVLLSIKPPNEIRRTPRSIAKFLYVLKASEHRNWLLFYSPIALKGILSSTYYKHWLLLVNAFRLLLGKNLTISELATARILIHRFIELVSSLYGQENSSYNIHILQHVIEHVERWGAPWSSSSFIFEDAGGMLKNEFHGTTYVNHQIFGRFLARRNYRNISRKFIPFAADEVRDFYDFLDSPLSSHVDESSNFICQPLGGKEIVLLSASEWLAVKTVIPNSNCMFAFSYKRMAVKGQQFSTKFYSENYKRDNSVVSYGENVRKVHEILKIILVHTKCNCRNDKNCLINKKDRTGQQSDYSNVIVLAKQLALSRVPSIYDPVSSLNLTSFIQEVKRNVVSQIVVIDPALIQFKCLLIRDMNGLEYCLENNFVFEKD
jgi:hypothetical protein